MHHTTHLRCLPDKQKRLWRTGAQTDQAIKRGMTQIMITEAAPDAGNFLPVDSRLNILAYPL